MGLKQTDLREHVIEKNQEDVPSKRTHFPITPAKQQLVPAELDRM